MRPVSPGAEKLVDQYYPVLDHGFVALKDYMGNDVEVERAARVSYGKGTRKVSATRGLIRYLYSHRHTTPFEMAEVKLHCAMPLFVARQWIRHRTASVNEYSGRYSLMPNAFYNPTEWRLQSQTNKQGSSGMSLDVLGETADRMAREAQQTAYSDYEWLTGNDVAKELSRINLPLTNYTQWYWKIDLHNLMHFLGLRADPHAQWEVRIFANAIAGMVQQAFPLSFEAWYDYGIGAVRLSRQERALVSDMLARRKTLDSYSSAELQETWGLGAREIIELPNKLAPAPDLLGEFTLPTPITHEDAFGRFFGPDTKED